MGLTPVHVNRTLKALEATGLITRNKRNIAFPSWQRMRDVRRLQPEIPAPRRPPNP
ncbi:MAG: helix-turn-helix domain-containing protein [Brevundimonas sp.]|nr:helix-turn-helix domain-containing protein [Brevundimonas sp.]